MLQGVKLYLNDVNKDIATQNNVPLNYSLTTNVTNGKATLGIDISKTNTNWVAIDNVTLRYLGTSAQLIAGEGNKNNHRRIWEDDSQPVENTNISNKE